MLERTASTGDERTSNSTFRNLPAPPALLPSVLMSRFCALHDHSFGQADEPDPGVGPVQARIPPLYGDTNNMHATRRGSYA